MSESSGIRLKSEREKGNMVPILLTAILVMLILIFGSVIYSNVKKDCEKTYHWEYVDVITEPLNRRDEVKRRFISEGWELEKEGEVGSKFVLKFSRCK